MPTPEESVTITARFPDLAGRSAIITGASRGIGCGIAEVLGRQGMKLTLCARSEGPGAAFTAELAAQGVDCHWVTANLASLEDARKVFDAAVARYGQVDLLVNNAAILWSRSILDTDADGYRSSFEDNVRMMYGLTYLTARHMVERKIRGSIVNISSVGGLRAQPHRLGYDMAKGAMDAGTRSMAIDLAQHGITVNSVAPGAALARPGDEKYEEHASKRSPRVPLLRQGSREEIGAAVAFLASDAGRYITGQVLYVDGGLTAQLAPPGIFV